MYYLKVKLPDDLVCSQCVLQWKYNTGKHLLTFIDMYWFDKCSSLPSSLTLSPFIKVIAGDTMKMDLVVLVAEDRSNSMGVPI